MRRPASLGDVRHSRPIRRHLQRGRVAHGQQLIVGQVERQRGLAGGFGAISAVRARSVCQDAGERERDGRPGGASGQRQEAPTETRPSLLLPPKPGVGEGPRELARGLEPVGGHALERLRDHRRDVRRDRSSMLGDGDQLAKHDLAQDRLRRPSRVRRLAGEHLIEHAPQRVDIGARSDALVARRLLGAHVVGRAHAEPGLRQPRARTRAERERDAEVGDDRLSILKEDVRGLDVPVEHARAMRVVERARDARGDAHGFVDGQLAFPVEPVTQTLPRHVRHRVIEEATRLPGVEERQDVGVLEAGGGLHLRQESLRSDDRGELGPEHLERDLAPVPQILGEVHRGRTALAELLLDAVAAD
jgi:hypothetical protein